MLSIVHMILRILGLNNNRINNENARKRFAKYKNEKEFYNTLWKIKYNIDVSRKKDTNFEIINLINS